jgi:hypothetical protein
MSISVASVHVPLAISAAIKDECLRIELDDGRTLAGRASAESQSSLKRWLANRTMAGNDAKAED